jgi:hypothetical protein
MRNRFRLCPNCKNNESEIVLYAQYEVKNDEITSISYAFFVVAMPKRLKLLSTALQAFSNGRAFALFGRNLRDFFLIQLMFFAVEEVRGQFTENYSDGDIHQNPSWEGDTSLFRVDLMGRLQQVAPASSGSTMLCTHSRAIYQADWSWWMRLGFNTSGSNYADIYLLSQSPNLDSALYGYFIRVGSSNDDVCLFRQNGYTRTCIINGRDGVLNRDDNPLRIRVTRDSAGVWSLYTDTTGSGQNWQHEGSTYDATHLYGSYTGHRQVFSSTRSQLFWYDDWEVTGIALPDTQPPRLMMARVARQGVIKLEFNKGIPPGLLLQPQQYALDGFGIPSEVISLGVRIVELRWNMTLPDEGSFRLCLMLTDSGGVPLDTCAEWNHQPSRPGDLIFNEVMPVPPWSGPLPTTEYVELRNMSAYPLNVGDWVYGDPSNSVVLGAYTIPAGGYLLLCPPGSETVWQGLTPVLALPAWHMLNNEGDELFLRHPDGWLADTLAFQSDWHASPIKKMGGWSLERRNGLLDCPDSWNWSSCIDAKGGTPGLENSIDGPASGVIAPQPPPRAQLIHAVILADRSIRLQFSRAVRAGQASLGGHAIPIAPEGQLSMDWILPGWLVPATPGTEWLRLEGWSDCRDCTLVAVSWPLSAGSNAPPGTLYFHEIYHRPATGGVAYYELIHLGDKAIDLSRVYIAESDEMGNYGMATPLSSFASSILPGQRLVLCRDTALLRADLGEAEPVNRRQVPSLPLPKAGGGYVLLLDHTGGVLDRLSYHDSLHHPIVADPKGLALERPDGWVSLPWSTADTRIRGTPGRPNSRSPTDQLRTGSLSVSPLVIYPRRMDVMRVSLECSGAGMVRIDLLDSGGRLLSPLLSPTLCRGTAEVFWDGRDAHGRWVREGMYLLRASFLDAGRQKSSIFRRVGVSWMNP